MFKKIIFLLLLLNISGLILAVSNEDTDPISEEVTNVQPWIIGKLIGYVIGSTSDRVLEWIKVALIYIQTIILEMMGYLVTSEDTSIALIPGFSLSDRMFDNSRPRSSSSFASALSDLFMLPFKMVIGSAKSLSADALSPFSENIFASLEEFAQTSFAQSMANMTISMIGNAAGKTWNCTRDSILPSIDSWITKNPNYIPEFMRQPVAELQSFYHITILLGII